MVLRRVFHMLKSIRLAFWLPFFLMFVVVPLLTYQNYLITDIYMAEEFFIKIIQYVIPISSVIWLCLSTISYFHDKGKELVWVHDIHTNNMLEYSLVILSIYLFVVLIFMIAASYFFSNMLFEFFRLLFLIMFFYSFIYIFLFAFKSTGISLIATALVYLFMLVAPPEYFRNIIVFTPSEPASIELLIYKYLPITFVSICLFIIGTFFSKRYSV